VRAAAGDVDHEVEHHGPATYPRSPVRLIFARVTPRDPAPGRLADLGSARDQPAQPVATGAPPTPTPAMMRSSRSSNAIVLAASS
jgi:hypothetical protein